MMSMREVWKVLGIEPTKDQRLIKRAYAQAVKQYHPEENPEEFQRVYAAYKQALAYAKRGAGQESPILVFPQRSPQQEPDNTEPDKPESEPEPTAEPPAAANRSAERAQIEGLFHEMANARARKYAIFRHKWQWYLLHQSNPDAEWEMRKYFSCDWFLDIAQEPEVMARLTSGIRYCPKNGKSLKEDIWRIYDLDHLPEGERKSDYLRLYQVLLDDPLCFNERKLWIKAKDAKERKEKPRRLFKIFLTLSLLLICVLYLADSYGSKDSGRALQTQLANELQDDASKRESESAAACSYLEETYPMATFSEAEFAEEVTDGGYDEERHYAVRASVLDADGESAEIDVTVAFAYQDKKRYVGEDFGNQYIQLLAGTYHLTCELGFASAPWGDGDTHMLLVGYFPGNVDLLDYMECFRSFVESDKVAALTNIEGVTVCVSYCEMPEAFLSGYGGMPEAFLYAPDELPDADTLAEEFAERISEYYIHMEPWSVDDTSDYGEWLDSYREKAEALCEEPQTDSGLQLAERAEELGEPVLIYRKDLVEYITVGDFYRMAQKAGIDFTVERTDDGFALAHEKQGSTSRYEISGADMTCYVALEFLSAEEE